VKLAARCKCALSISPIAAQVPPGKRGKDYDEVTEAAEKYQRAAHRLADLGLSFQTSAGLSPEAHLDFQKVLFQDMKKKMGGCTNIAILFKKYSDFCMKLSQDGDPRFYAWIECIHRKQRTCGAP
jgi:hypothetical protein